MSVRYRNKKTGTVSTYATVMPTLEVNDNWARVTDADERPNKSDTKDEWVTYATRRGVDTDGKNKDEIVAAVEALDAEQQA